MGIPDGIPSGYGIPGGISTGNPIFYIQPESRWDSHWNPGGIPAGFPHIFSLGFTEIKLHLLKQGGGVMGQGGYLTHYTLKT